MKVFKVILSLAVLTWTHVQASDDEVVSDTLRSVLKGSVSSESEEADARKLKKYPGYPGYYDSGRAKPKTQYPKKCGGKNQACCDDAPYCKPTLGCHFNAGYSSYGSYGSYGAIGKCVDCGVIDQPCCQSTCGSDEQCANTCQPGATCDVFMNECVACGEETQACCDDDKCRFGNTCNTFTGKCEKCGDTDDLCCDDNECKLGNTCNTFTGKCQACGTTGIQCCDDDKCVGNDNVCNDMNTCVKCGGDDLALMSEPCCENNICNPGFVCNESSQECEPCGGETEQCCDGQPKCETDLVCNPSQVCEPCGDDTERCCEGEPECTEGICIGGFCNMGCTYENNGAGSEGCTTNEECCKGCCTTNGPGTRCTGNKKNRCPDCPGFQGFC